MTKAVKHSGESTQEFFTSVVEGTNEIFKPLKPFKYLAKFTEAQDRFREVYDKFKGNFDEHIATSIPLFRETQVLTGSAIADIYKEGAIVYDLGGSEGGWIKAICQLSENIQGYNIEPNKEMQASFNLDKPQNCHLVDEAFYSGWDDIKPFKPTVCADVVHESMLFQFLDNAGARVEYIKEVKSMMKADGIFLTEQKFRTDRVTYNANEQLKNDFKRMYYSESQLNTISDEVLVGMEKNQAYIETFVSRLSEHFEFVCSYWKCGNFVGILATDSLDKYLDFMYQSEYAENKFSNKFNI